MKWYLTIRDNEACIYYDKKGRGHIVYGPKRLLLLRKYNIDKLQRFVISKNEKIVIRYLSGEQEIIDGPTSMFLNPIEHKDVCEVERYSANSEEYLKIIHLDGEIKEVPGPVDVYFDNTKHQEIVNYGKYKIDANEVIVKYIDNGGETIRELIKGPDAIIVKNNEWLHQFNWHGSMDEHIKDNSKKVPGALKFEKLWVVPDQMYYDVDNVRTKDDILIKVHTMIFFELSNIEKMLDNTHDVIADFINGLSSDVIKFVGQFNFENLKDNFEKLNQLESYKQTLEIADKIGYHVSKIVFRGYYVNREIQEMHNNAVNIRTDLMLKREVEEDNQKLSDYKLTKNIERSKKERDEEVREKENELKLIKIESENNLKMQEEQFKLKLDANLKEKKETNQLDIEQLKDRNKEELSRIKQEKLEESKYLELLKANGVDLTKYFTSQFIKYPDKYIQTGDAKPFMFLNE